MLVFGFGVSTDVNNLSFAVLDHDQSPESRAYLEELRGSTYFVEKAPLADYARTRKSSQKRQHQGRRRNPARLRPRHQARTPRLGRRLGGRRHAVPGGDHPRLSAGHARAVSGGPGGEDDRARPAAARRHRAPVQVQPGFRQHLRDGACGHGDDARAVSRDPDGAGRRARKGARLDHQSLRDPGHPVRIPGGQAAPLHRGRRDQFRLVVLDGVVRLPGSAQGQLAHALCWGC